MLGNKSRSKHYRSGGTRGGAASFDWNDVKYDVSTFERYASNASSYLLISLSFLDMGNTCRPRGRTIWDIQRWLL